MVVLDERGDFETDIDVFLLGGLVEQIDRLAIDGDFEGLGNGGGADAVERGLFLVDDEAVFLLVRLDDTNRHPPRPGFA